MQVSVIIVNYKVQYFLEQCLFSVLKASVGIAAEIIVVDNHSADESKSYLEPLFPTVRFIWLDENVGFAKANNIALQNAKGENILFLNPDTIIAENSLFLCLEAMKTNAQIGALGIRMIDGSGQYLQESKRGYPTAFTAFCKLSGLTKLFPHSALFARYYLGHLDAQANQDVEVLAGAFMLVRKSVLDNVGSFDTSFFMYGEDVDLSFRIQKAGFINRYFAQSTILHFKGESTQKASEKYIRNFYGAMALFVEKHHSKLAAFIYKSIIRFVIVIKQTATIFSSHSITKTALFQQQDKILLIGTAEENTSILHQLEQMEVEHIDQHTAIQNTEGILDAILASSYQHVIFTAGEMRYQTIIECMENASSNALYWIHDIQSNSMVCSSDKNRSGNFMLVG